MTAEPRPAFLSVGELFGGVERHLIGMCTWMQRQGREPVLILFHDRELAQQARQIGVEPVILTGGSFDLGTPRRLARILAERDLNVVHAHGYRAMVNAALARRYHRFGAVRTVHGLVETQGGSLGAWKSRAYTRLEQIAARRSQATVCYVTEDLLRRNAQIDSGLRTITVHNGIDPLEPAETARPDDLVRDVFHFAAVGRVSPVKGLEYAVEALARTDPASPAVLDVIGTGELVPDLERLAQRLGMGDRVRFLGFRKNIYDYLAHADVLLMPSLHEGLPYTVLEALSLGTPILASRTGGLAEILTDGETASLVEVGDVDGLAASMSHLVENPDLCSRLAAAGRDLQRKEFTLETMGASYWDEYRRVAQCR